LAWRHGHGQRDPRRPYSKLGAWARLDNNGIITIETEMTDLGTGSYTIVTQTAAEMMRVGMDKLFTKLDGFRFPETPGFGGQQGAPSVTAGSIQRVSNFARSWPSA
jgi:xanthine dehydrogenase YagR molybdenum-binding subunit